MIYFTGDPPRDACVEFLKLVREEMHKSAALNISSCKVNYDYEKWGLSPLSNAVFILNMPGFYAGARIDTKGNINLFVSWPTLPLERK